MSHEVDWKIINLHRKSIPDSVIENDSVTVMKSRIVVKGTDVFYREGVIPYNVQATGKNILLLHGKSHTSETWGKLRTIQLLAAMGHRAVAVDLPGYGRTRQKPNGDKDEFLLLLITSLDMRQPPPIIVSPSMSGGYSCAFLKKYPNFLSGYVPIAPAGTEILTDDYLKKIYVPTLFIYGSEDATILARVSLKALKALPNIRVVKMKEAAHAAYLSKPALFHKVLFNFLCYIK